MVEIKKLRPYQPDGMPRLTEHERGQLKESIEREGILTPLIVSTDGSIVDGNHRYEICLELSINEVPCVVKEYKDDAEKLADAVTYQLARRNLKTHQRYLLAYRFWQKFGYKGGKGRPDLEEKKEMSESDIFSDQQIADIFGFGSRTTMVDAVRPYGNAHDFLVDAEGKWSHSSTHDHSMVEKKAEDEGVRAVINFAHDLAMESLETRVREEAKKIKKEKIYANVKVVDGTYRQFSGEELLGNRECQEDIWNYIVSLKKFIGGEKTGEFSKIDAHNHAITICVTKIKEE